MKLTKSKLQLFIKEEIKASQITGWDVDKTKKNATVEAVDKLWDTMREVLNYAGALEQRIRKLEAAAPKSKKTPPLVS